MKKLTSVLAIAFINCAMLLCACGNSPDASQTTAPTENTTTPVNYSEPEFEAEFDDLSDIDVVIPTQDETTENTEESTTGENEEPTTKPTTEPTTEPTTPTDNETEPTESTPSGNDQEAVPTPTDEDGRIVLPMIPG